MAETIDLDAARAARAEVEREAHTVRFGGETFTLPLECPFTFAQALDEDKPARMLEALFGATEAERFMALGPSVPDLVVFVQGVAKVYGLGGVPESSASNGSSPSSSRRSKPTSRGSTGPRTAAR